MRVFRRIEELALLRGPVHLAIGVFDGVHRGHQEVIRAAIEGSRESGGSSAVLTFDPHPAAVLRPELAPTLLTSSRTKERLLDTLGIDAVLFHPFDKEVAGFRARDFVQSLAKICDPLGQISVGWDWTFGKNREGDTTLLRALGTELDFSVTIIEPVMEEELTIRSTAIRAAVFAGDVALAGRLLGHAHCVSGRVEKGRQLGRQLGFPTANLVAENTDEMLPANGVYAVQAEIIDGVAEASEMWLGVANLGVRPTIDGDDSRQLEAHLFDFQDDIYDRELRVSFIERLRGEQKFDGIDALKSQIAADAEAARAVFNGALAGRG